MVWLCRLIAQNIERAHCQDSLVSFEQVLEYVLFSLSLGTKHAMELVTIVFVQIDPIDRPHFLFKECESHIHVHACARVEPLVARATVHKFFHFIRLQ